VKMRIYARKVRMAGMSVRPHPRWAENAKSVEVDDGFDATMSMAKAVLDQTQTAKKGLRKMRGRRGWRLSGDQVRGLDEEVRNAQANIRRTLFEIRGTAAEVAYTAFLSNLKRLHGKDNPGPDAFFSVLRATRDGLGSENRRSWVKYVEPHFAQIMINRGVVIRER
jgi:hypothetical protein